MGINSLEFIDRLSREECLTVVKCAHTRMKQLLKFNPVAYAIRRTWSGGVRFRTYQPSMGWRQTLATDLQHSWLWLTASKPLAEEYAEALRQFRRDDTYEVIEILKAEVRKLPCYRCAGYDKRETFAE